jgi:3-(3-hydroxy-phenyl)propionate hydroxylase
MNHPVIPVIPVVIIGAGPTGLTAATLLAQHGVECLVLERWDSIYPQPRAVHLDDEVYRILARLGIRDEFAAISRPCRGLRLVEPDMTVLAELHRDTDHGHHGYPQANMFDQPELEALLRANLPRHPSATLRGGTEVTALTQDGTGPVRVDVTDHVHGTSDTLLAAYVLGCDGANSIARTAIDAHMTDLTFDQRWLVVDVDTPSELAEWDGVHQVCDTRRAGTYMRIGDTRYRWEFRLSPTETADDYRDITRLHPLIAPWTKAIPLDRLHVVRAAEYTFRAQLADRWRDRRIFLLGDAAHLTPPFIGQGMGAGLRDAANLAWKLAVVLSGGLSDHHVDTYLDTYEAERKPHARAMIRLAKLVGTVMTGGGELGKLARRLVAPRLHHLPGIKQHVLDSRTPPLRRTALVARPRLGRSLAGRLCPNAVIDGAYRFDDLAAGRFALVTTMTPTTAQQREIARRKAVVITAAPGTDLHRWLRQGRAHAAVVRPDGTVQRTGRNLTPLINDLTPLRAACPVPTEPPPTPAPPLRAVPTAPATPKDQP